MSKKLQNQLFGAARAAYDNAHAPYSKFPVGAAVLAGSGKIYNGCNVENASSPEGLCAEASAIAAMVAAGEREIVQICVVCKSGSWAPPCGGCRQKIREFGNADTKVLVCSLDGRQEQFLLGDLLPNSFGPDNLETTS